MNAARTKKNTLTIARDLAGLSIFLMAEDPHAEHIAVEVQRELEI